MVVYAYMLDGSRCSRREELMSSGYGRVPLKGMALNCFLNRFDEVEEEMTAIPGRGDVRAKV